MNPERWKHIDKIFHAALDQDPAARNVFLADACKEDDALRIEIEDLLASHERESSLFENPPIDLALSLLAKGNTHHAQIAHYNVLEKIGKGGMGEVYLAEDTRLNRKVALKLLPKEFSKDQERIRRFEREARTVTALNHPYILTIYDIGQIDSGTYIASEFIEGETLRQHMRTSKLSLKESLSIVIQVAEALDAAHQAGIVHRDMKPENIMLRKDGYVKVLDFGLSKPIKSTSDLSILETVSSPNTQNGMVLGTIRYMSPEQARGLKVDARTDIFSLGIVLYEMITTKSPFKGPTAQDMLVSILDKQPPHLNTFGEFPEELQWTLTKSLAKDADERYQTAKDLLADLKRIRKKIDIDEEIKRSGPFSGVQRVHKTRKIAFTTVIIFLVLIPLFVFWKLNSKKPEVRVRPFSKIKVTRLTSNGNAWSAAISSDGKYVAYIQTDANHRDSLFVKQLATDTEILLVTPPPKTSLYDGCRFSPDGNSIYYMTFGQQDKIASLYQISILGGTPHKLIEDLSFIPAVSPDGKKLAFVRYQKSEYSVIISQADGSQQRKLKSRVLPEMYRDLEWSPDGKTLAAILNTKTSIGMRSQIIGIDLNGTERPLSNFNWISDWGSGDLDWISDGSGLLIRKVTGYQGQIHYLSLQNGAVSTITNDPNNYIGVSVTKDSNTLVTTQFSFSAALWTAPSKNPQHITQLTSGSVTDDGHMGISWTSDNQIIYSSRGPGGDYQICRSNADGSNQKRLTSGKPDKFWPVVSPDGRYIVYNIDDGNQIQIWRMDINGDNPRLLSGSESMRFPQITPDSKWIICSTMNEKKDQKLIKLSIDGTTQKTLASHLYILGGMVSPKGKQIAYAYQPSEDAAVLSINIIPIEGGKPLKTFQCEADAMPNGRLHWKPDGSAIAYIREAGEVGNVYLQPTNGSAAYPLTGFTENRILNFTWSADGKNIAYSRGKNMYDIVLIQNIP